MEAGVLGFLGEVVEACWCMLAWVVDAAVS